MNQSIMSITRKVQSKDRITGSVYVTLPSDDTGLNIGDTVEIEIVSKGYIILKKMQSVDFLKEESFIDRLLEKLGLHNHYEITKKNEMNTTESTNSDNKKETGTI